MNAVSRRCAVEYTASRQFWLEDSRVDKFVNEHESDLIQVNIWGRNVINSDVLTGTGGPFGKYFVDRRGDWPRFGSTEFGWVWVCVGSDRPSPFLFRLANSHSLGANDVSA